jgi:hypothetical protein
MLFFKESQRFSQWWLWLLLMLVISNLVREFINGTAEEKDALFFSALTLTLTSVLFGFMKLETTIDKNGVSVRFFPFHLKKKHFNWDQLESCSIRTYKPIIEYGGWGIRKTFSGKGTAYNVKGKVGLQLVFKNGDRLLIGTQKAEEMNEVLKSIDLYGE